MKLPYPQSVNCLFLGFPVGLSVNIGKKGGDFVPGASFGTRYILKQTPQSGVLQGEYEEGSVIPDYAMIYSDTGSDDDFTLKISFLGYGTFYKLVKSDQFFRGQVYKATVFSVPGKDDVVFDEIFDFETKITSFANAAGLFDFDDVSILYKHGDETATLVVNGVTYVLSDNTAITVSSLRGDEYHFQYHVNGFENQEIDFW